MRRYKVYVGCSLTHAPQKFHDEIELFKKKLSEVCDVLCFLGCPVHASANEIYEWDVHGCVYNCDLMVAVCDLPSTGLGYEIATQVEARRKPLLAIAKVGAKVSDLIIDPQQPGYTFRRYQDLHNDAYEMVKEKLLEMDSQPEKVDQLEKMTRDDLIRRCRFQENLQKAFSSHDDTMRRRVLHMLEGLMEIKNIVQNKNRWFKLSAIRSVVEKTLGPLRSQEK